MLHSCIFTNETKAAADFYEKCLLPKGFGTGKDTAGSVILTPLNKDCQKICRRECEAFSRKFKPYKMLDQSSKYAEVYSVELNEDVILDCYSECQKGGEERFTSYYFDVFQASCEDEKTQDMYQKICVNQDYTPAAGCTASLACNPSLKKGYISFYKVIQQQKASVGLMCQGDDAENSFNIVQTDFEAKAGDLFSFSLLGGAKDNQLYLCGRKHIEVDPLFYNIGNDDAWYKLNFKNRFSHRFLATISGQYFEEFKKNPKNYWNGIILKDEFQYVKNNNILEDHKTLSGLEEYYGAKQFWKKSPNNNYTLKNSIAGWGAKNPNYFDTGIHLKNGDILSIVWEGNFSSSDKLFYNKVIKRGDFNTNSPQIIKYPNRQNVITDCIWDGRVQDKSSCIKQWYENSNLIIQDPQSGSGSSTTPSSDLILQGECFREHGLDNFALNYDKNKSSKANKLDNYSCDLKKCIKDDVVKACIGKEGSYYESGLFGSVTDIGLEKRYIDGTVTLYNNDKVNCTCKCIKEGDSGCDKYDTSGCADQYSNYNCINKGNFEAGEGKYVLQGTVDNPKFVSRQKFNLKSYDKDGEGNNSGGYKLTIDWRGCPKSRKAANAA